MTTKVTAKYELGITSPLVTLPLLSYHTETIIHEDNKYK